MLQLVGSGAQSLWSLTVGIMLSGTLYIILFSCKPVMQIAVRLITGNPLYMLVHAQVEFKVLSKEQIPV